MSGGFIFESWFAGEIFIPEVLSSTAIKKNLMLPNVCDSFLTNFWTEK